MRDILVAALATLIGSALLTGVVRKFAISRGVIDVPNTRSSHATPTPRGGGLAIVLSATAAFAILSLAGGIDPDLCLTLVGGGGLVAAIGLFDDRRPMPAAIRLVVHALAAVLAVVMIGGLPQIALNGQTIHLGWMGSVLGIAAVLWVLNLFNFMDGIDGIAASEAVFVTWAAFVLLSLCAISNGVLAASAVIGAACLGFLRLNWPPAKIFMGDVGSGYIGFVVAALALASTRQQPAAVWLWLILGGVFFVDATVALVRRLARAERIYEAHRSHAYQWQARRWGSHLRVTVTVLLIDVLWLLPCAAFAALHPSQAAMAALVALAPLVVVAVAAGSGRSEIPERTKS